MDLDRKTTQLQQIEKEISAGRLSSAKQLLAKITPRYNFTTFEKIRISRFYCWLGEYPKALKILGRVRSSKELKHISEESICLQITCAQTLNFLGAKYVAERMFQEIDLEIKRRRMRLETFFPQYFRSQAEFHINRCDYQKALAAFKKVSTLYEQETYQHKLALIGMADSLEGIGQSAEAISLVTKLADDKDTLLKGISLQARGEYFFRTADFKSARRDLETAMTCFVDEKKTKDLAYLLKWSGALALQEENLVRAQSELKRAFHILDGTFAQPRALLEVLYWLEQANTVSLRQQISLRGHHSFSPYSCLVGRNYPDKSLPLHPWIRAQYQDSKNNCWHIDSARITPAEYKSVTPKIFEQQNFLDLVSGLYVRKGKVERLTKLQANCLAILIGAAEMGVYEISCIDFLYRQEFVDPASGLERLRTLCKQLKQKGFPVTQKKHYYYCDLPAATVILPMNLQCVGEVAALSAIKKEFQRSDLECFLQIPERTANRLLQTWIKHGLVKRMSSKIPVYSAV